MIDRHNMFTHNQDTLIIIIRLGTNSLLQEINLFAMTLAHFPKYYQIFDGYLSYFVIFHVE